MDENQKVFFSATTASSVEGEKIWIFNILNVYLKVTRKIR